IAHSALGFVYDKDRHVSVLFGGSDGITTFNETWEWGASGAGLDWVRRFPVNAPAARRGHAMTYDEKRKRVVLFGGGYATMFNETWEYDGTDWTKRQPSTLVPARIGACMTFD